MRSATVGPCLPWSPQEADVRRLLQAMGSGGANPAGKRVPYRDGDLEIAGALGIQPGTFGSGIYCAADPRWTQTPAIRVGHVRVSTEDRRRPLPSTTDHPTRKNVTQVTC